MPKIKRGETIKKGDKALQAFKARRDDVLQAVRGGATHKELSKILGVGTRCLEYMLAENPDVEAEILKAGQKNVNEVKSAQFMRATGQCERTVTTSGPKGTTVTTETIPPDISAIKIYLTNYDSNFKILTREEAEMKKEELKMKRERLDAESW